MAGASGAVEREVANAARMWLEYATEGDESCRRATGLDMVDAVWVAHGLLSGDSPWAAEQHARHRANVAIDSARHWASRAGDESL